MSLLAFTPNAAVETVCPSGVQTNIVVLGVGRRLRIVNAGAAPVHVLFYEASATPPTVTVPLGMILLPGAIEIFSVASDTTRVAVLNDGTAAAALNVCRGEGQ